MNIFTGIRHGVSVTRYLHLSFFSFNSAAKHSSLDRHACFDINTLTMIPHSNREALVKADPLRVLSNLVIRCKGGPTNPCRRGVSPISIRPTLFFSPLYIDLQSIKGTVIFYFKHHPYSEWEEPISFRTLFAFTSLYLHFACLQ